LIANNKKLGFGLIEVILATTIIIIILAALVFLSQTVISNQGYALQRIQALNFAQANIEKIRQSRDTNYIDANTESTSWNSFVDGASPTPPEFDYVYSLKRINETNHNTFVLENANKMEFVAGKESIAGHLDQYTIGVFNNVRYYVTIRFVSASFFDPAISNNPNISYRVICTVYWDQQGGNTKIRDLKKVQIIELITDFRPRF